jgi:hypothetical protein
VSLPVFCVPSMVVSLNQRRRGGYLTATIQIPSWLPSCAPLYQSRSRVRIGGCGKAKKSTNQGVNRTLVSSKILSIALFGVR